MADETKKKSAPKKEAKTRDHARLPLPKPPIKPAGKPAAKSGGDSHSAKGPKKAGVPAAEGAAPC